MTEEPKITKRGFTFSVASEYMTATPGPGWPKSMLAVMKFGSEGARKSHQIEHPIDPAKITAHAEFKARWDVLIAEGEKAGLVDWEYDGGYYVPDLYPRRETVWDETEEEWAARMIELEKRGKVPPAFGVTDD